MENLREYIKDWISDLLRWLQRNDTWQQRMENTRNLLGKKASLVRFIFSLVNQSPVSLRANYRKVKGPVKGTWFGQNASRKTEQELAGDSGPVIYYIHGGAFISGNTKMWTVWMNKLISCYIARTGKHLRLFCIDYTLALDASFPTQSNQCLAGVDYLVRQLNIAPTRLFISGDSAGANLALQTLYESQVARSMAGAIIFSPWVYPCMSLISANLVEDVHGRMIKPNSSWFTNVENDYIAENFGLQGAQCYIGKSMSYLDACESPQINPSLRTDKETLELPKILCLYGEGECLRDQIDDWIQRLKGLDKDVDVVRYPGGVHDWPLDPGFTQVAGDFEKYADFVGAWIHQKSIKE